MSSSFTLQDFDFELPQESIAQNPVEPRDSAKLLEVFCDGNIEDRIVSELPDILQKGDLLIFNDTKVIPARLFGSKEGYTARIELMLHKQVDNSSWQCFAKPARKLAQGDNFIIAEDFYCKVVNKNQGEVTVEFNISGDELFLKLHQYGDMPLPPYIDRKQGNKKEDNENYQTIYAKHQGAVAAPTAGLHFTEDLFERLDKKGIEKAFVTLHVGAGTFLPVKVDDIKDHKMHSEYGEISSQVADKINKAKKEGRRLISVGTTSLRLLESAAQSNGVINEFKDETDIFITPGYKFKIVDILVTNFHLPKSTLFMLVSAFSGRDTMLNAYKYAIQNNYRFYSYGDASILYNKQQ